MLNGMSIESIHMLNVSHRPDELVWQDRFTHDLSLAEGLEKQQSNSAFKMYFKLAYKVMI